MGHEKVAIVGAGLTGSLLAAMLGQRGYEVTVYERRPDPRAVGAERGRSINLAISTRGLTALEQVGLADDVLARALPMRGRMLHSLDGSTEFQPYSPDGEQAINSISRGELNAVLLDAAERQPSVTIRFEHKLSSFDVDTRRLVFEGPDGTIDVTPDVVIGADGAFSVVRRAMQSRDGFDYRHDYLSHSYKELTMPPKDGDFAMDPDALHIWPRGGQMMIALPNLDKSFTCTLFWPRTGPGSFESLATEEAFTTFFRAQYPDAAALMPDLDDDFHHNPVGSLLTVRCAPWTTGTVTLVGDAAHAICPFYGQGANAGFEDCLEMVKQLEAFGGDWAPALTAYADARKPHSDAIADLALHNFIEMRDSVNSPSYKAVHAAEQFLERTLGDRYRTRYTMVSFSTTPYAEIEPRLRRQRITAAAVLGGAAAALIGVAYWAASGSKQ